MSVVLGPLAVDAADPAALRAFLVGPDQLVDPHGNEVSVARSATSAG
jgi:hypothetical protein